MYHSVRFSVRRGADKHGVISHTSPRHDGGHVAQLGPIVVVLSYPCTVVCLKSSLNWFSLHACLQTDALTFPPFSGPEQSCLDGTTSQRSHSDLLITTDDHRKQVQEPSGQQTDLMRAANQVQIMLCEEV